MESDRVQNNKKRIELPKIEESAGIDYPDRREENEESQQGTPSMRQVERLRRFLEYFKLLRRVMRYLDILGVEPSDVVNVIVDTLDHLNQFFIG